MPELHTIYRPEIWEEMFGNKSLVSLLRDKVKANDFPKTSMLSGQAGCGKTTLARLVAKQLGCDPTNIREYNIADDTGVDNARKIAQESLYRPLFGKGKEAIVVYILDEFHRATSNAQDCLLKPFESPPKHAYFILCTTDPAKVIKTIKSRCTQFEVEPLNYEEMKKLLFWVYGNEDKENDEKIVDAIISASDGIPRNALKFLDLVIDITNPDSAIDLIKSGIDDVEIIEICRALANGSGWKKIAGLMKNFKGDPERSRLAIMGYFAAIAVNNPAKYKEIWMIMDAFKEPLHYNGKSGLIYDLMLACEAGE